MVWQQNIWHRLRPRSIRYIGILILLVISVDMPSIQAQAGQSQYYIEKLMLDQAKQKNSVDALNQFMLKFPKTSWMDNAIYYRDEVALKNAKAIGTVESIENFIKQYPDSVWLDSAVYARDKAAYTLAKTENTQSAYEEFIKMYPNSRWKEKAEYKLDAINKSKTASLKEEKSASSAPTISKPLNEPASPQKRVNRALQIYSEIDKKRQLEKQEKLRKEAVELRKKKTCHYLKDRLKRYGERVKWYRLDENGNREFSTEEQVTESREKVERRYAELCSS